MTARNDSVAVRAGEELDVAALAAYLRDQLAEQLSGVDPDATFEIEQFPGGHSNLTYLIRYGDQEFVLRRPPVGPVAPTAHDMPREYKFLSVVNPHFPLAPKPILLCEDTSIIGVPFYLMERRRGFIVRSSVPNEISENLALRRHLSRAVVDTLVALHAVDIHSARIVDLGKPEGFVARQIRGWADRWERSKTGELAEMDRVLSWLRERVPPGVEAGAQHATIVHNDFKLDNLMFDERDPSRIVAVLDWEMCTVGDPLVDLGLALSYWTMLGGDRKSSLRAVTNGPGWMTREEIIERYETMTGRDLSRIAFYETFAHFKVAVVIQQIYFRYVQGQTHDKRFRNFDSLVRELVSEALELAKRSGI
ncbi:MAG: phosphotransferase family protein [Pyrinomonadaceae bacterium]|nr:phosphotransferase family protein [Pyrinomonadaceae bacterium]